MSRRSRLNRHLEDQGKRTIVLSIVGIIVILFLLIRFGIPFIADLGFLSSQVSNNSNSSSASTDNSSVFLSAPQLNPSFDATNSAQVTVSGTSSTGKQVAIYLNGTLVNTKDLNSDGTFSQGLTLSSGDNIIEAKAVDSSKQSDFSDPLTITYKNTPPNLTIDSPSDGSTVNVSNISVSGKTDSDTKVTVNGFWAILDGSGNYSYNMTLQNGSNHITVDAVDSAGNKTEKTATVTYSP